MRPDEPDEAQNLFFPLTAVVLAEEIAELRRYLETEDDEHPDTAA